MECFIVESGDVEGDRLYLRGDEAHHAVRSLRLRVGDEALVTDLAGTMYRCRVYAMVEGNTVVQCAIEARLSEFGEPTRNVMLIQGMISQPARWEFLLEKAVELGVRTIVPVTTERTEHIHYKRERSERILRAAAKQTRRARLPEMVTNELSAEKKGSELSSLREALSDAVTSGFQIVILHESAPIEAHLGGIAAESKGRPIAIVVGPEGGFSDNEIEMAVREFDARVASLGMRRLRAETAAIAALAIVIER